MFYLGDDDGACKLVEYSSYSVKDASHRHWRQVLDRIIWIFLMVIKQMKLMLSDFICKKLISTGYRGRALEHSKVRIICDKPLLTLYLYILIHARRRQDSRRTIDLLVTNPRITEWPRPGTVRSEALPLYPVLKFKERKMWWFLEIYSWQEVTS